MTQLANIPIRKLGTCLDQYIPSFDATLAAANYTRGTIMTYRIAIRRLASKMVDAGVTVAEISPDIAAKLLREERRPSCRRTWHGAVARRFVQHLIQIGVAPAPVVTLQEIARCELQRDFENYLYTQRGLGRKRVYQAWHIAARFLDRRFGTGQDDFAAITPRDVSEFLQSLVGTAGSFRNRDTPSLVRLFFQYLFSTGKTPTNLSLCVLKVAHRRFDRVPPRYLPAHQINRILEAVRGHPKHGARGYAMLLLMARLGLRAPEVIAIQLDDIDWRAGELLVRGKGGFHDRLPIPVDVGEAITRYVRDERVSDSRALFVTRQASNAPFETTQIINKLLTEALALSGVQSPGRYVGSRVLRHSLATDLVRNGASLDEIAEVLRHRSRATTMIYAKVDLNGLQSIAQPWPVVGDVQ